MNKKYVFIIIVSFFSVLLNSCKNERLREIDERNAYLQANNITIEPNMSGLYYIEVSEGLGRKPELGEIVTIDYIGKLLNGVEFYNTYEKGKPITFILGKNQVPRGMEEGVSLTNEGGKAILIVPSNIGFGSQDVGSVPAFSTVVFEIELIDIDD